MSFPVSIPSVRTLVLSTSCALVALALAACGGGGDDPGGTSASASADATPGTARIAAARSVAFAPDVQGMLVALPPNLGSSIVTYPSLRQVYVDQSNPAASDSNPGTATAPWRSLAKAMVNLRPGDEVVVGPGVYREQVNVPALAYGSATTTTIRAATPGTVTVKGSDLMGGWLQVSSDTWSLMWTGSEPEQVWRGGVPLKQIGGNVFGGYPGVPGNAYASTALPQGIWPGRVPGDKTSLQPDSFTFSIADRKLYVRLSTPLAPNEKLEVSDRTYVMYAANASGLLVDGLVFAQSNTSASQRRGAVYLSGSRNVVRNVTIQDMDAFGITLLGDDNALLTSSIVGCGQVGVTAGGNRVQLLGNRVIGNNTRGFNTSWEAGGMKLTGSPALVDATVSYNLAANNLGIGIWFDWTPLRVAIQYNTTAYNQGHGIHYEAASQGTISGNYSYGNTQRGIYLLETPNNTVSSNIVFANALEGIAAANGTRSASEPALLPYGNVIVHNTSAWNNATGNRIQLMLPGLAFGNQSDANSFMATDVTPRYAEDWVSGSNPYKQGLPNWRAASGQDLSSTEAFGAMPASLASLIGAKTLLSTADLPPLLQKAGI